ncbi:MAG: conserved hypothetical protein TIGR00726 [Candidatus Berkelbacteria bacterium Licking1014_85]|uniref:Purine nucleoside phosphorylase n=1 Tax=Candidatus Berkelbacteria bacterium Licking1014_85 TaxID=2017148 RepID=A0A554LHN7_9BACT|nr:MAG: conserved hypothetical protein TIGR00726 [Candidatus Berkelbacteria bacterium Licking1014_85]
MNVNNENFPARENASQIERETQIDERGLWRSKILKPFLGRIDAVVATKECGPGWIELRNDSRFEKSHFDKDKFRLGRRIIELTREIDPEFNPREVVYPSLNHTNKVVEVTDEIVGNYRENRERLTNVDGLITNRKGTMLMVLTADCPPIAIYDPENHAVGLFHSGWKGTVGNIAGGGIQQMVEKYHSDPQKLIAVIGPGHSKDYEVKQDLADAFRNSGQFSETELDQIFIYKDEEHFNLDLHLAINLQLQKAGIPENQIEITSFRTDTDNDLFPSHRAEHGQADRSPFILYLK